MKRCLILITIVIYSLIITGCSVNVGISSLNKATTAIIKADGDLSLIEKSMEEHKEAPINLNTIEKKLNAVKKTLTDTEKYVVDETFEARHTRVSDNYEIFKKEFRKLKLEAEEKEKLEKKQKLKEKEEKKKQKEANT